MSQGASSALIVLASPYPKQTVLEVVTPQGAVVYRNLLPPNPVRGLKVTVPVAAGQYIVERFAVLARTSGGVSPGYSAEIPV
jgi:hypothetical protein